MWDDRFIFVLSALFGISLWIVISKRRAAIRTARPPWLAYGLLTSVVAAIGLILVIRYFDHAADPGMKYPSLGSCWQLLSELRSAASLPGSYGAYLAHASERRTR
jgi:hypothetical protein